MWFFMLFGSPLAFLNLLTEAGRPSPKVPES